MTLLFFFKPHYAHHQALLESARKLLSDNHVGSALITAWTACEVLVEGVCSSILNELDTSELQPAVTSFIQSYSLGNDKIRRLYCALTKHQIQNELFWSDFISAGKVRQEVVHDGKFISEVEAVKLVDTIEEAILSIEEQARMRAATEQSTPPDLQTANSGVSSK